MFAGLAESAELATLAASSSLKSIAHLRFTSSLAQAEIPPPVLETYPRKILSSLTSVLLPAKNESKCYPEQR
jgi:hypothetical protein